MNMYNYIYKQDEFILRSFFIVSFLLVSVSAVELKSSHVNTLISPCNHTLYPEVCESLLLSDSKVNVPATLGSMFDLSVKFTIDQAHEIRSLAYNVSRMKKQSNSNVLTVLDDCVELLDHSLYQLTKIKHSTSTLSSEDIQTWLSTAITHHSTCLESLENDSKEKHKTIDSSLRNSIQHISNSLALHITIETQSMKASSGGGGGGRRLLSDDFPAWVGHGERRLLESSVKDMKVHAVVAMDGTGTHKSIAEALASVSSVQADDGSGGRTVIHVRAGTYKESGLNIPVSQSNVMLVGDGKGITVITGNKNAGGGYSTFRTATLGVSGDGFIARDITFENTAGPGNHQAVALVVSSDKSVFYRCSINGYQDTLYTLSNRQFYRETDISGTVDFIFGNSAVVFQSCNIIARSSSEKTFITAQGRSDPNQNTGISIHKCRISGKSRSYLGRPWKQYSRTVVMQTYIDGSIDPAGWFPWSGNSYLSSLYYAEYANTGPGASTGGRVKWSGYHSSLSPAEASKFTVGNLISGNSWLPSTSVPFDAGM